MKKLITCIALLLTLGTTLLSAGKYKSYKVSVYCRAYEVEKMADPEWLESTWKTITDQIVVGKKRIPVSLKPHSFELVDISE